jgi:electron transfer flavoprotein alpha subunit
MTEAHGGVLVYSEARDSCLELLGKARQVAAPVNLAVSSAVLGEKIAAESMELGPWGADRVYRIEAPELRHLDVEPYTDALVGLAEEIEPQVLAIGGSKWGYELAPRVAARLRAGCVSSCVDWTITPGTHVVEARSMLYAGLGIATYRVKNAPAVLVVPPSGFPKLAVEGRNAEVIGFSATVRPSRLQVLSVTPKGTSGASLESAEVVIDIGQGVRCRDDLAQIQKLADLLGAQLSCTRPISSERGWLEEWVGLSGRRVSPRLCITLGVSGAIQHMVGIRGSQVIVAVDSNPDSAMLVQADYGVVMDLYEFVPALIEALRTRGVRPAKAR